MSQANKIEGIEGRKILVTGASGFLGRRLVETLVKQGCLVRAFVRRTSNIDFLRSLQVDIRFGDVSDPESLKPAFEGIDYVVHAAADTGGSEEGGRLGTIQGTRNILGLCELYGVGKLVYISSCSVYGVADCKAQQLLGENAPLERFPEQRGAYSWAKLEAEKLVSHAMAQEKVPIVCLRPGTIYGPGSDLFNSMMGFSLGTRLFIVIGDGDFILPLVHIDNLVTAITVSLANENSAGRIYNVVDPERVNKRRYVETMIRKLYPRSKVIYLPYVFLYFTVFVQEKVFSTLRRRPILTRYRLMSSQKPILYDVSRIVNDLNWRPVVTFEKAVANLMKNEQEPCRLRQ